ncbi:MAG: hypothetical protein ACPKQO_01100 [Nitrososphaeraceae archaeon]
MRYSNKITSMCIMSLVLIIGYSLNGISGMNFQDRMAYSQERHSYIELNNESNQKFTLQKETKEHFKLDNSVPKTIEPGKDYTIEGQTTNLIHDGIIHLYYTYGKNYTAEFSSYFIPNDVADNCKHEAGSSEISISCSQEGGDVNKFEIKNTN